MPLYAIDGKRPLLPADGSAWIAPTATVIGAVVLGAEASIWFGAVIRADNTAITIGPRSNVQDGAVLHSDPGEPLAIGAECTIGHNAMLHGCTLGDRVLVGMVATVLNGARIGDDCLIGAGALVTGGTVFPSGQLIVGAPARAVRALSDDEIAGLRHAADGYVAQSRAYAAGLQPIED